MKKKYVPFFLLAYPCPAFFTASRAVKATKLLTLTMISHGAMGRFKSTLGIEPEIEETSTYDYLSELRPAFIRALQKRVEEQQGGKLYSRRIFSWNEVSLGQVYYSESSIVSVPVWLMRCFAGWPTFSNDCYFNCYSHKEEL